jgi:hypothetical protein
VLNILSIPWAGRRRMARERKRIRVIARIFVIL